MGGHKALVCHPSPHVLAIRLRNSLVIASARPAQQSDGPPAQTRATAGGLADGGRVASLRWQHASLIRHETRSGAYPASEYLIPMRCRNFRSYAVSTVGFAFGRFADAAVRQSRQQSERGFTEQMLLRHRGHRQ